MLTPDQVKPFLTHQDEDVRALAADYFSDSWSQDPEILSLILDARERFGDEYFLRNLTRAKHFVITGASLDRLILELDRADSEPVIEQFGLIISKASVELLSDRWEVLANHPKLKSAVAEGIARRRELLGWPGERLWDELRELAHRRDLVAADGSDEASRTADFSDELIEALAARDVPDTDALCRLLAAPETKDTWLEIHLTTLAGRRRLHEAIPLLVDKFHREDADFLIEEASEALARIGDVAGISPLVVAFPSAEWSYRFSAANTLGDLKHRESEAAILKLLKAETENDVRTMLCVSLCELISENAVEIVRREIASGSQMAFRETAPLALAVATMLGQELPKVAVQWEREKKRQHEAIKKASEEWESDEPPLSMGTDGHELGPEEGESPAPIADVEVTRPIRNEGRRVGRNDPCPCGSSKKYKKCCGAAR